MKKFEWDLSNSSISDLKKGYGKGNTDVYDQFVLSLIDIPYAT